jgi:hypothetical protein
MVSPGGAGRCGGVARPCDVPPGREDAKGLPPEMQASAGQAVLLELALERFF